MSALGELAAALQARGADRELPSLRRFREAYARTQASVQVVRALERQPVNAGPLNSHALVLQAFSLLQELSPESLRRLLETLDTLDVLERASAAPAMAGKPARKAAAPRRTR